MPNWGRLTLRTKVRRRLSSGSLSPNLAPLSKEDRKTVSFGFADVQMIRQPIFVAGQADRDPVIAGAEGQLALGQGSLGVASSQFCHRYAPHTDLCRTKAALSNHALAKQPDQRDQDDYDRQYEPFPFHGYSSPWLTNRQR